MRGIIGGGVAGRAASSIRGADIRNELSAVVEEWRCGG
jgi:hypothetical protein